jgi:hypothetical protein
VTVVTTFAAARGPRAAEWLRAAREHAARARSREQGHLLRRRLGRRQGRAPPTAVPMRPPSDRCHDPRRLWMSAVIPNDGLTRAMPPKPPTWTEHADKSGVSYWHNADTGAVTWARPKPTRSQCVRLVLCSSWAWHIPHRACLTARGVLGMSLNRCAHCSVLFIHCRGASPAFRAVLERAL